MADTVEFTAALPEGLNFISDWIYATAQDDSPHDADEEHQIAQMKARARFGELIRDEFENKRDINPLELPNELWRLIWDWQQIDADSARQWLQDRTDTGAWPLIDLIARFASTSATVGAQNPVWKLSGLDLETIENLIGLNKVFAALHHDLNKVSAPPYRDNTVEATRENRRSYVLAKLKMARDQREA